MSLENSRLEENDGHNGDKVEGIKMLRINRITYQNFSYTVLSHTPPLSL